MKRPDKLIFLDFDGVIVHHESPTKGGLLQPSRDCVERLNRIVDRTAAAIVVTSQWRIGRSLSELREVLKGAGFRGQVIGATKDGIETAGLYMAAARCDEIKAWVKSYPACSSWIAIDDESMPEIGVHMVFIDQGFYNGGMQDHHALLAIAKLQLGPAITEDKLPRHNNGLLRLCTKGCPVRHYENCPDCFGYGMLKCKRSGPGHEHGGLGQSGWPAAARYTLKHDEDPLPDCAMAFPCPSCLSTLDGAPA